MRQEYFMEVRSPTTDSIPDCNLDKGAKSPAIIEPRRFVSNQHI